MGFSWRRIAVHSPWEMRTHRKRGSKPAREKTIRTLVVDDSPVTLRAICTLLKTRGVISVVGTAKNGRDAVTKAKALHPDLVLMDMEMPGVQGLEATSRLRSRFPTIRIIIVTVHDSPEVQRACAAADAHGFVSKSRIYAELFSEIDRVFERRESPATD
jgi:DNA-binding NarL/FixJ family response regulator